MTIISILKYSRTYSSGFTMTFVNPYTRVNFRGRFELYPSSSSALISKESVVDMQTWLRIFSLSVIVSLQFQIEL